MVMAVQRRLLAIARLDFAGDRDSRLEQIRQAKLVKQAAERARLDNPDDSLAVAVLRSRHHVVGKAVVGVPMYCDRCWTIAEPRDFRAGFARSAGLCPCLPTAWFPWKAER